MLKPAAILIFSISFFHCFAQQPQDEIRLSINFGGGSAYINEEQAAKLHEWLDTIPNLLERYEIQLIRHTDPIG
jgi:hypothetical protein